MASDHDTLAELIDQHPTIPSRYAPQIADRVIAAGWRPPAREITDPAELDELAGRPVVLDSWGEAWQRIHGNWRHISGRICAPDELVLNFGPKFTVLNVPTEEDGRGE